jgi:hypothetical protein
MPSNFGLEKVLDVSTNVEKVTLHISQFEKKNTTAIIANTLTQFERRHGIPIPFEIIRLTEDSDFSVFDLKDPGYVSEEGTVIGLAPNHALLVTEGRRERDVWRGRKPVSLELRREHASSSNLRMRDTVEDAFFLSSVNTQAFNAVTQPVTLLYPKLLAEIVGKMSQIEPQIGSILREQGRLNEVPWFV